MSCQTSFIVINGVDQVLIVEIIKHSMSKPHSSQQLIQQFIRDEQLPADFETVATDYFLPLADYLAQHRLQCQPNGGLSSKATRLTPLVVGINGAQGTGKSTLSELLKRLLQARHLQCVVFSIDDLYLTRAERASIARNVHPLLQTRGVPGTHDLAMGMDLLAALKAADSGSQIAIPRFDKATDDRCPEPHWPIHSGPVDVIIIEGWCVGAPMAVLSGKPINALEQEHDADGRWRAFIETQLAEYQQLFSQIDKLLMLKAPSMESVIEWRTLQEQKLRARTQTDAPETASAMMNKVQLHWFIMHYERLTRMMLDTLPERADVVFDLDNEHRIVNARYRVHHDLGHV
jgi:D-glycerate 3-kinase